MPTDDRISIRSGRLERISACSSSARFLLPRQTKTPRPHEDEASLRGTTSIRLSAHSCPTIIGLCCNGHSRDGLLGAAAFLRQQFRATSAATSCGDFHRASPSLSGMRPLTTPEVAALYAAPHPGSRMLVEASVPRGGAVDSKGFNKTVKSNRCPPYPCAVHCPTRQTARRRSTMNRRAPSLDH